MLEVPVIITLASGTGGGAGFSTTAGGGSFSANGLRSMMAWYGLGWVSASAQRIYPRERRR